MTLPVRAGPPLTRTVTLLPTRSAYCLDTGAHGVGSGLRGLGGALLSNLVARDGPHEGAHGLRVEPEPIFDLTRLRHVHGAHVLGMPEQYRVARNDADRSLAEGLPRGSLRRGPQHRPRLLDELVLLDRQRPRRGLTDPAGCGQDQRPHASVLADGVRIGRRSRHRKPSYVIYGLRVLQ